MTVNQKPTGMAASVPGGLAWGALTAIVTTLTGAGIAAKLIDMEWLSWDKAGYAVLVILLLSAWIAALVTAGKVKRQRLAMCLISGVIYFLVLMAATALFFGGQYSGVGETGLLIFCGSMLGVFAGYGGKRGRNNRKIQLHSR